MATLIITQKFPGDRDIPIPQPQTILRVHCGGAATFEAWQQDNAAASTVKVDQ